MHIYLTNINTYTIAVSKNIETSKQPGLIGRYFSFPSSFLYVTLSPFHNSFIIKCVKGRGSLPDDVDSIGECASLLHPDHAWVGESRRGSSQSETLEVEVYQLGKDFSRSLPGSRRSSFQQAEKGNLEIRQQENDLIKSFIYVFLQFSPHLTQINK